MTVIKKHLQEALKNDPLLDRAFLFLEDGERDKAKEYFERVLDQNARSPFAYLGKLIIALNMEDMFDLPSFETSYTEHADFVKALRFSEGELHDELARIANTRDTDEATYKNACEIEKSASTVEELVKAYNLYSDTHDFADSEDHRSAIEEAVSVIQYYADRGAKRLDTFLKILKSQTDRLQKSARELNSGITMAKALIQQNKTDVDKMTAELNSLGIFKGKRKKELSIQIALKKQGITKAEEDIKNFQVNLKQIALEQAKANAMLLLEGMLDNANKDEAPMYEGIELVTYTDDKIPLRALKNVDTLAIVVKHPLALHEILHDDNAVKVILSTKKHLAAVGQAHMFKSIAVTCTQRLEKFPDFIPYLPIRERLKAELKKGKEITFGMFPKDGVDPYKGLILPPGVPYERIGKPVKWTVLQQKGHLVTLICSKDLMRRHYESTSKEDTTWINCNLRQYMQGQMFDLLFNSEERELIVPMAGTMGGKRYVDKITLPFFREIKKVLPNLPDSGFAWTADKLEISKEVNGSSILTEVSVAYLAHKGDEWHQLVHQHCYVVPKITIQL